MITTSFHNLDLLTVGTAIAGIGILGFLVFINDRQSVTNRSFLYLSLAIALWSTANYANYQFSNSMLVLWILRLLMLCSVVFAFTLFKFLYVFPKREVAMPSWFYLGVIPVAILAGILTLTPLVFQQTIGPLTVGTVAPVETGFGIVLFAAAVIFMDFGGLLFFAFNMRRASSDERKAYRIVLAGLVITVALIVALNFILPAFFQILRFIPFGAVFIFPFIAFTSYSIYSHHLFNLKVVTTAVLGFMVTLFTFINILNSTTASGVALNLTAFVIVLLGSVRIVRDTINLVLQREEIEKLSQEKSEFMSFASHEIRNPITAMRGYASLLVDGTIKQVSDPVRDVAQKIFVNGNTVLSLISEFLNKSKLELGQIAYNVVDTDLGKVISNIGEGFKAHAREKGLTLDVKIDFPGLMAKADEAKLHEVIGNLIDNSIKYTKSGGVTVEVEKRNGMGRVIVSDTGVGIPPETISHLFQKFSRADAQKMNLLGTGLGLYLAKTFIEGMGGKIWAESDGPNKGSRFIIELHTV